MSLSGRIQTIVLVVSATLLLLAACSARKSGEPLPFGALTPADFPLELGAGFPVAQVGDAPSATVEVGQPAPNFAFVWEDGRGADLASLRGKPVILNFWATWCPPCRREMPALEVIWQQHNRGDVVVLGVDQGESVAVVSQYVRQNVGVTFPLLLDRRQDVGDLYLVRSLPTTFFIDAEGIIREMRVGGPMELDFLNQQVQALGR